VGVGMSRPRVVVSTENAESLLLWEELGRLARDVLPAGWTLIGGLMVQIHAFELFGPEVRVTEDIDVLGDARRPGTLARIRQGLVAAGFVLAQPSPDGVAYRFTRDDLIVDLLAPEGLREPASLDGAIATISVSGGSQALARSETIDVQVGDSVFAIERPTLLGAILIKARAIRTHSDPDAQRADLALLLSLVEDPRALGAEMSTKEKRWLREAEPLLRFDEPGLGDVVASEARLALGLMTRVRSGDAGTSGRP
jgi:hypothetical protein